MTIQRALLSVWDKTGLIPFAAGLVEAGAELIASGGTGQALRQAGLPVRTIEEVTGFPEMLGGRVKTLHPAIHAGLLARDTADDRRDLAEHGWTPIDLVAVNLYPFAATVARPDATLDAAIEHIDIGGVALLRAAAKNFARVTVICDPADYARVLEAIRREALSLDLRRELAYKAFAYTAAYDATIRDYLAPPAAPDEPPAHLRLDLTRIQTLRYGENPHQVAALYALDPTAGPLGGRQLQG
ncbi:MAG: bifunctional phosphoribosylaminoimidazolecarboxamide formyltransferase/inosine monophosphate cyclohydrolase, partial [Chloroflexota bacterium]